LGFRVAAYLGIAAFACVGQQPPQKSGGTAPQRAAAKPKFKAIWEPVNYPEDVNLNDVFFVNGNLGWVTGGQGGLILNTQDGGDHWSIQWGDPHGAEQAPMGLFMLDATHGWARQGYNGLLQTTDGQVWVAGGKMDPYTKDYVFTSPTVGVSITDHDILRTTDAGRTYPWPSVNHCTAKIQVSGLTREVECSWSKLNFPAPSNGYALGYINGTEFGVVGKTADGGATWSVSVVDGLPGGGIGDGWFFDANTGFIRTAGVSDGQLQKTSDGAATWKPAASIRGQRFRFVDRQVGWSLFGTTLYFTVDGGLRWISRSAAFPVNVNAWSLGARDRGYVVGNHGMIYRYRIVPVAYTSKGMLEAPMMPSSNQ
jgi:photosystem II stability/assembly factor-like uncharacterized protein